MDALVATMAVAAGAGLCVGPMAARYVSQSRLGRLCRRRRSLALTFDDGPGEGLTPALIDLLARHDARASFFPLGFRAEQRPDILDSVAEHGHEIGCHSYRHVHPWKALPWVPARDVRKGFEVMARWVPEGGLFRPPHGKLTPFTWAAARARRARFAWWTIDSGDTWDPLPDPERIVAACRSGGVVLMHDFEREAERATYVLELTERLVRLAAEEDLRIVPLGVLLGETG